MGAPMVFQPDRGGSGSGNSNSEHGLTVNTSGLGTTTTTRPQQQQPLNESTNNNAAVDTTSLPIYLKLVDQYLELHLVDNATFLAERCVAEHASSLEASYMLALAYYRGRERRRARMVLDPHLNRAAILLAPPATTTATLDPKKSGKPGNATASTNLTTTDEATTLGNMRYLYATCSYELQEYGRAEDMLLKECRRTYQRLASTANNSLPSMEEWIVQATPCPIPNGAAGLALLGKVCRKSNRKDRAIRYFQMSLQLDPFLWTSFQALAELGTENIDPTQVFGVAPPLPSGQQQQQQQQQSAKPQKAPLQPTTLCETPLGGASGGLHHSKPSSFHPHAAAAPASAISMRNRSSATGAAAPRPFAADTPGLTPIPSASLRFASNQTMSPFMDTPQQGTSLFAASSSAGGHHHHALHQTFYGTPATSSTPPPLPPSTSVPPSVYQHRIVKRASHVANGRYYPPSPHSSCASVMTTTTPLNESSTPAPQGTGLTTNNTPMTSVTRSMRYLRGLGVASSSAHSTAQHQQQQQTPASTAHHENHNGSAGNTSMTTTTGGRSLFLSYSSALALENQAKNQTTGGALSSSTSGAPLGGGTHYAPVGTGSTQYGLAPGATNQDTEKPARSTTDGSDDDEDDVGSDMTIRDNCQTILQLLSVLGSAYQHICNYKCDEALRMFQILTVSHKVTGWVLHQQGRAYLEMSQFQNAQRCLEAMQRHDPGRMKGLELLSTVYWQLKNEFALANLSQKVVEMDRMAPEAWCVIGNCFSLQKDHESALVFFRRSLQLDPDFYYTHTLSGYEYMANEDFEKAIACFRQAIRIDSRHYNAWYGLGAIAHRQEKFDVAEIHFQKAVNINPSSSVLRCNLGIAQHANNKSYQALDTLQGAFVLDPRNPQARFQRATIYSSLGRPEEALAELEMVRDVAPREATIFFAMGKVLKRLGRQEEAMKSLLIAMDLDPKDNHQMIKSALDKLDEPEVDEEAMGAF